MWAYLLACFFMGFGIAADVMAAVIAAFREFGSLKAAMTMAWRVTVTHTLFPIIGILAAYYAVEALPVLRVVVGALAVWLLGGFLWELVKGKSGLGDDGGDDESDEGELPWYFRFLAPLLNKEWRLVIGVSIDALLSGPAKAAQAEGWTWGQLAGSFPVVGLVVGGCALVAARVAWWLETRFEGGKKASPEALATVDTVLTAIEFGVLGYFLWLAFAGQVVAGTIEFLGWSLAANWEAVAAITTIAVTTVTFGALGPRMWRRQKTEVEVRLQS